MTIRKLAAFVPLAVLVGALVHLAGAGLEHAPGGRNAPALFVVLGLGLAVCLAAAFLRGAFGTVRRSIATPVDLAYGTIGLAAAGAGSYAVIELLEGHIGLGGALRALAASIPVAAAVLALSRRAAGAAGAAGARIAAAFSRRRPAVAAGVRVPARRRRTTRLSRLAIAALRGRAPPLFV